MPIITVNLWEGRTLQDKKQMVEGITSVMTGLNIPAEAVHIVISENPMHNTARGGQLASERFKQK